MPKYCKAIQGSIIIYAACIRVSQIFKLDNYKPLVMPISIIVIAMSLWVIDSVFEQLSWGEEVYPYYALPFQVFIPILVLIFSIIKNKMKTSN